MFPRIHFVLRNQQGEGSGGSSGSSNQPAGGAQNAGQQGDAGQQSAPQYMTSEHFNRAFTERFKRAADSLLADLDKTLTTKLEAFRPKQDEAKDASKPDEKKALEDEYLARLKAVEKRAQDAENKRAEEAAQRARSEERSALINALNAQGITGARASAVVAWLHGESGRVTRAKDGGIVFRIPRDGYDDEVEITKGVAEWLKTEEGKEFAPARSVGGSGEAPKQRPATNGKGAPQKGSALLAALGFKSEG